MINIALRTGGNILLKIFLIIYQSLSLSTVFVNVTLSLLTVFLFLPVNKAIIIISKTIPPTTHSSSLESPTIRRTLASTGTTKILLHDSASLIV